MCGISVILSTSSRAPDAAALERMNAAQFHRGPDGSGVKLLHAPSVAVGLGHRRLSIIDLAAGHQPMANEDETIWVTYNGEIYNHAELREELIARGHRYATRCDTETIVHAYEEWGPACVERFRGMFAFAVWDSKRRRLFAARDRLGIKPFYYRFADGELLCASEIKGILASEWIDAELNRSAIPEHLALGYLCGESTLFAGVRKLLPGQYLLWENDRLQTSTYWDVPRPDANSSRSSARDWTQEFLELFRESVRLRLMSDVPLGVFLSGGLDSSAIAATMAAAMSEPVKTFSVGFAADYYSELDFAREVAQSIGAEHHEVILDPDRMFALLPRLIWHEDEPIRNASSIALYEVARLAASEVKVVLTGEGSDELFAGYERYWATRINQRWGGLYHGCTPRWLRESVVRRSLWNWPLPLSIKKKLSHTFLNHDMRPESLFFENWHAILGAEAQRSLLAPELADDLAAVDPYRDAMRFYEARQGVPPLDQLLYADQKAYLVELLMKQDTMSMAASIESRVPFLDHKLVEFAAQVPAEWKIRGFAGKYLVKQAMRQILPESIINRKKMGFPVPVRQWFRERPMGVVRKLLLDERTRQRGIFDATRLAQLCDEHVQGMRDHTDALWTTLNFEVWARVYLDGQGPGDAAEELAAASQQTADSSAVSVS